MSKTVTLALPINIGGVPTDQLTLRRPKVRDRLAVERANRGATDAEMEVFFLEQLCDLAPGELAELDMGDYNNLQKALTGFLSTAPSKT